jgi:hypothetical protein
VAHLHVYQIAHDFKSSLGNYFKFIQDMEVLDDNELKLEHLWSKPQLNGWIHWTKARVSGSTQCNKALHMIHVVMWLADKAIKASPNPVQKAIGSCLQILRQFSEVGKRQYLCSIGKALNEEALIKAGATLHPEERPVFILWLLDRIEAFVEPFKPTSQEDHKVDSSLLCKPFYYANLPSIIILTL